MNRLVRTDEFGPLSPPQQLVQHSLAVQPQRGSTSPLSYFLPSRYEANYRYPLVVWLHNDGANHRQVAEVMPHVSTQNFVAVGVRATRACEALGHQYAWLQSPLGTAIAEEVVFAAIESTMSRYSVNPERIYLAGYREGGTMAMRIGLRNAARFDGVISVDGQLPRGGQPLMNLAAARDLAILSAVSLQGTAYPMTRVCEDLRLWHAANLRMDMRQYTVDDCMVTEVMRDINTWIMSRVTGQQGIGCLPDHETVPVEFSAN